MSMTPIAKPNPLPKGWRFPRRGAFLLLLIGMTAAVSLAVLTEVSPHGDKVDGDVWVTVGSPEDFEVGVPVRPEAYPRAWIVREDSGDLIAFAARDPHSGCVLPYRPDFVFGGRTGWFRDPCHGGTYDLSGDRAFGPAPRDLDRYVLDAVGGKVRIDTTRVICGGDSREVRRLDGTSWPCSIAQP